MNIIVCIKQVPDTADIKIDPATKRLFREGIKSMINPFDMYAIEEGLRLKEKLGGKVTAITMGPPQAESALREAIALGCDEAILISDPSFVGSDTLATCYILSQAIKKIKDCDLIFCGKQTLDGECAHVGPGIAGNLDIPQIVNVRKIQDIKEGHLTAERMTEYGYDVLRVQLPCLITVVKDINVPRLPSLKGKMKAKSAQVSIWKSVDIGAEEDRTGVKGSGTDVWKVTIPPARPQGKIFEGETAVDQLVEVLKGLVK